MNKIKQYQGAWTEKQLKHLLRRILFGVTDEDIQFFKGKSMSDCVKILLQSLPPHSPPILYTYDDSDELKHTSFVFAPENKKRDESWKEYLRVWWVGQMSNPQRSITEKMTLFWHNHFVVDFDTVKDARYCYHYVTLLRKHATGNFKKLLKEITVSPAMLVYLNGNSNTNTKPNENYGRELQELFTIGKGSGSNYTENDVKAATKVLSGWKDDKKNISSYFEPAAHNSSGKAFSAFYNGQTIKGRAGIEGATETDELLELICNNSETAKHICRKLYRWFVQSHISQETEQVVITPLADVLVQNKFEIKPVLQALFTADFFYSPQLIGAMFKSPADYFIGLIRELKVVYVQKPAHSSDPSYLGAWHLVSEGIRAVGQHIGSPPSVAGWPAYYEFPSYGKNWVSSEYLAARNKFSDFTFEGFNPPEDPYIIFAPKAAISSLKNPEDATLLVKELTQKLLTVPAADNQIRFLVNILEENSGGHQSWKSLWNACKSKTADASLQSELNKRLKKLLRTIILLPEYQIM